MSMTVYIANHALFIPVPFSQLIEGNQCHSRL